MILATIAISISSYYRDISNYRHYRPALLYMALAIDINDGRGLSNETRR